MTRRIGPVTQAPRIISPDFQTMRSKSSDTVSWTSAIKIEVDHVYVVAVQAVEYTIVWSLAVFAVYIVAWKRLNGTEKVGGIIPRRRKVRSAKRYP